MNRQQAELAAEVMGVGLDGLTSKALGERYKELIKVHHPDAGGEHEDFIRLQHAKGVLVQWLDASRGSRSGSSSPDQSDSSSSSVGNCASCGGKGYVSVRHGFSSYRRVCPCQLNQER